MFGLNGMSISICGSEFLHQYLWIFSCCGMWYFYCWMNSLDVLKTVAPSYWGSAILALHATEDEGATSLREHTPLIQNSITSQRTECPTCFVVFSLYFYSSFTAPYLSVPLTQYASEVPLIRADFCLPPSIMHVTCPVHTLSTYNCSHFSPKDMDSKFLKLYISTYVTRQCHIPEDHNQST
jgi:hypothetical protein